METKLKVLDDDLVVVLVNGRKLHLVLHKTISDWKKLYGNDSLWGISADGFLDGTLDINEDIWYWYINGRLYETHEPTN